MDDRQDGQFQLQNMEEDKNQEGARNISNSDGDKVPVLLFIKCHVSGELSLVGAGGGGGKIIVVPIKNLLF